MPFNSPGYFLLFLPAVFLLSLAAGKRFRWALLLAASVVFYGFTRAPYLLAALFIVTVVTWAGGKALAGETDDKRRSAIFWTATALNVAVLIALRYVPVWTRMTTIVTALGVSYYVFQAIAYLVDVHIEVLEPERHFGYLALYLAFFPKLLQGPIERGGELLPQLHEATPNADDVRAGLLLFAWGLFKKVIIADRLALFADSVYRNVHSHTGIVLILATYFYALQIYYDFSGYTDMALGSARLFGIRLTQNFLRPYFATSIVEFWRRWHISFSRWILDYLFKPLQMVFRNWRLAGTALALIITFLICGAWHGPRMTFVIWGLLHGVYMASSVATAGLRKNIKVPAVIGMIITFHLVCFAWIFFRAATIQDALYVVTHLASGLDAHSAVEFLVSQGKRDLLIIVAGIVAVEALSWRDAEAIAGERFRSRPLMIRWVSYYALTAVLLLFAASRSGPFIYFQF